MPLTEYKSTSYHFSANDDGLIHGVYKDMHGNGQVWEQSHFINGVEQGRHTEWFPSGAISEDSYYADDAKHGEFQSWDINGNQLTHVLYCEGSIITLPPHIDIDHRTDEDKCELTLTYGPMEFL